MARRFQFRLEQVLNLRKQTEDVKSRELAEAKGRLLQIEETLKEHKSKEEEFLATYADFEKSEPFNAEQVMAFCDYKDWLSRREREYRKREKEWIREVERRRLEAVKASKARQLLENLKDRQMETHNLEVLGEEQRFLDEISSIAFVRRERAQSRQDEVLTETSGR
jgi:flagellar protein FliJ